MDPREKQALFERIVAENASRIRYIARNGTSPDNWKDLEQEILLALWKSLDGFKGSSSLTTSAINVAHVYRRNNNRREEAMGRFAHIGAAASNNAPARDAAGVVNEFLPSLSMRDRFVFLMYLDDRSYREISEATGIAEANLRVRMSRIKQQFTQKYIGH